jgi:hypothetical protein
VSDAIAMLIAFIGTVLYLAFPIIAGVFLSLNLTRLNRDLELKTKYGSLYAEIKTNKRSTVLYLVVFLSRRLVFAASAVFLTGWPLVQVNLLFIQSLATILYLIHYQPLEGKTFNNLEIFNEGCVLAVTYPVLIFAGYSSN